MAKSGSKSHVNGTPSALKGIGLMLAAMAVLPYLDVAAKFLGQQGMPVLQIVWGRMAFGALLTLPFVLKSDGAAAFIPSLPGYQALRAILLLASTAFFFAGLNYLSVADTLAIFFVQPLVLTLLSPFLLGEHVGWRRWIAVAVGFCGTLIIIRPGLKELNLGVLFALLSGTSLALYLLLTRRISGRVSALVTTFQTNLIAAVILTVTMFWIWVAPNLWQWFLMALVGLIAVAGHYLIVRSYDYAEASLLAPLAYTEMITAVIAGWFFFGDFPDIWTFAGVAILIACVIYISWRERARGLPSAVPSQHVVD
jgi:drug/metabolite transporter (DMT)-like permease